jgi:hypothetical protein
MIGSTLLLLLAADAAPQPGLAVMDFAVEGAPPEIASAVSGLVAHELERLQLFHVTTAETTRVILGVERQRQLLGCDNCSGSSMGELTSFEFLVTGKLVRTGGPKDSRYNLMLTLLKVGSASPLSSVRVEAKGEEKLLQEVPPATTKLVGKLLEGRQGSLVVGSSEVGAAVKIDDTQVGTTPLQARLPMAAGPHLLSIEKDGFSQVKKEVRISPDQVSDEFIRMVPSPDMAEAYEAKARRFRLLAWVSTGVAVGGVAAFVVGNVVANSTYGDPLAAGTFSFYRAQLLAGNESEENRTKAGALKSKIELMQTVSWIGVAAAATGAIAATVLFVVGDPPGRYEAYRQTAGVVSMSLSATPGGMVLSGSF